MVAWSKKLKQTHPKYGQLRIHDEPRKGCWVRLWEDHSSWTVQWRRSKFGDSQTTYSKLHEHLHRVVAKRMQEELRAIILKEDGED
jgi:hypothetical protein